MPTTSVRFALVGVINTAFGFALILLSLRLGLGDYAANVLGYGLGFGMSYALNRSFTFKASDAPSFKEFGRFAVAFGLAYAANLVVLSLGRDMGLAGQPMLHFSGLGLYSILFYFFSRTIVFNTERNNLSNRRWQCLVANYAPEIVLLIIAIFVALVMRDIPLTHDVVWQLWIAHQIANGAALYRDIMELNPPLWFWSAVPLAWAGNELAVPTARLLVQGVIAAATLSALIVGTLVEPERSLRRASVMVLVFACEIVLPLYDFGQREQLALISALPYAALLARRHAGARVPWHLALTVGLIAAYGFALKHYFAVIPVGLEIYLVMNSRRGNWQPLRPETMALAGSAVVYAWSVLLFAPDFLGTMLPMVRAAYHGYESAWPAVLLRPWTIIWGCLATYIFVSYRALEDRDRPLITALLITAAGFLFAYLLQRKGWLYHSVPVTVTLSLAAGAVTLSLGKRNPLLPILGVVVLALPFALPVMTGTYRNLFRDEIDPVLATVAPGETLFIAATDPMWGWPNAEDHGLVLRSRYYAYWMLPAIAHAEIVGPNPATLKRMASQIRRDALEELRCGRPALIIFERRRNYALQPAAFDIQEFFTRSDGLKSFVADYYTRIPSAQSVKVYRRTKDVPIAQGLYCPPFRKLAR